MNDFGVVRIRTAPTETGGRLTFFAVAAYLLAATLIVACQDAPAQDQARTAQHQFVASSRGQVYYPLSCDAWKSLAVANLRYFRSAADAERAGYTPTTMYACAAALNPNRIVPSIGGSAACSVARIVDGDTFDCATGDRVRLLLVDTPELSQGAWGDSARKALATLLPIGSSVRLQFDVELRDPYDRLLAYVYRGSAFVNRDLARRGMAAAIVIPPNVRHVEVIRAAIDSARREKLGLWRGSAFDCLPADFRAGRCGLR